MQHDRFWASACSGGIKINVSIHHASIIINYSEVKMIMAFVTESVAR
tara:strand:+ start:814 stop:954 length:141 start_codon:yes stop_codon:yes gene_type:complete